jgi:hypothetical protein
MRIDEEQFQQMARDAAPGAVARLGFPFWLRLFVRPGVLAITLGNRIYVARSAIGRGEAELARLLRHEWTHVEQMRRLGLIRFLYRYAREYLHIHRSGLSGWAAYAAISFEVEARAAEDAASLVGASADHYNETAEQEESSVS